MNEAFTTRLGAGQALTLAAARAPRRVVVTSGRLWLTLSGGTNDHWLQAGEGLILAAGQEAVVEAWPEAAFQLLLPAPQRRPARPAPGWRLVLAAA
ncbi:MULTISPECIES: DUF2917 domain-containing protein [unclassified Roseateles]|uniref:DUF2917 domain-containing protein n=1 Tax=unclassified Roseateles TaxID=2626991 RepID=UPI0006F48E4C|nr:MULTISPECIES: DUF2917 domain-containing protein [unclassified Roseateles]KQW46364.1 hypothetical protein ASC81_08115 [Pelomonas sp. Root405]KRA73414.1 hypothetical protein ASD88_08115 [Pelomonas sp. Root662]